MLCAYVAIIWKVIGKKSTEDARKPSGRELKELKSKSYFLHFYAWSSWRSFFELKFLRVIVLPVLVLHNYILFLEIDGFCFSHVKRTFILFGNQKNEVTEDFYFTPNLLIFLIWDN